MVETGGGRWGGGGRDRENDKERCNGIGEKHGGGRGGSGGQLRNRGEHEFL